VHDSSTQKYIKGLQSTSFDSKVKNISRSYLGFQLSRTILTLFACAHTFVEQNLELLAGSTSTFVVMTYKAQSCLKEDEALMVNSILKGLGDEEAQIKEQAKEHKYNFELQE
ncbi:hypothetical protein ACJX0J_014610, partial [Zea mays]